MPPGGGPGPGRPVHPVVYPTFTASRHVGCPSVRRRGNRFVRVHNSRSFLRRKLRNFTRSRAVHRSAVHAVRRLMDKPIESPRMTTAATGRSEQTACDPTSIQVAQPQAIAREPSEWLTVVRPGRRDVLAAL